MAAGGARPPAVSASQRYTEQQECDSEVRAAWAHEHGRECRPSQVGGDRRCDTPVVDQGRSRELGHWSVRTQRPTRQMRLAGDERYRTMALRPMDLWPVLVRVLVVVVLLRVLVWWLEPRMAFFPLRGVQETPADLGIPYRELHIETNDQQKLHAWWVERPVPRAQVIFFHGNGGNLSLWLDVLVELWRRNFSVLAVDYRGYGMSTGTPSEKGLYRDAEAIVRFFSSSLKKSGSPTLYWGRSIGAPVAAYAASVSQPDALVLETPMPDVRSVLRTNPLLWALSFLSSYEFPTVRMLEQYRAPLLVIHGDSDTIVPFSAGRRVFEKASTAQKTFVAIRGGDHNDLHVVDPTLYWESIDQFVATLLNR